MKRMRRIQLRGEDSLSKFTITRGTCGVCGRKRTLVVTYLHHPPAIDDPDVVKTLLETKVYKMLTWTDLLAHTILGRAYQYPLRRHGHLGIQCGCLQKFHRQMAHVAGAVQAKIDRFEAEERAAV